MDQAAAQSACCGVILSGGRNTRMAGRNKAFLKVGDTTILDRLIATLQTCFEEIVLVTREPALYADRPVRVVQDIFPARASLTGIHAGLSRAATPYAFVVPCDIPFLRPALITTLVAAIDPAVDVVVPLVNGYYEPLCAIYSKRCLAPIEAQLRRDDFKITRFFEQVRVKPIALETLQAADAELASFFNVNTPEALTRSRQMAKRHFGSE